MSIPEELSGAEALALALSDEGHARYIEALREAWGFDVLPLHLQEPLSIAQVEARETVADPLAAVPGLPFGHLHGAWSRFLSKAPPECELWSFAACEPLGRHVEERILGYAAVRGGVVVASFVTMRLEVEVDAG